MKMISQLTRVVLVLTVCSCLPVVQACSKHATETFLGEHGALGLARRDSAASHSRTTCEVHYRSRSATNFLPLSPSDSERIDVQTEFDVEIRATLELTPLHDAENPGWAAIRMIDPAVALRTSQVRLLEDEAAISQELERPFFAKFDASGQVLSVQFSDAWSGSGRNFAKALLSLCQFVRPGNGHSTGWDVVEEHNGVAYTCEYALEPRSGTGLTFKKTRAPASVRLGNEGIGTRRANETRHVECKGALTYTLGDVEGIRSASGEWSHAIEVRGKRIGSEKIKMRLAQKAVVSVASNDARVLRELLRQYQSQERQAGLSEIRLGAEERRRMLFSSLQGETTQTLLALCADVAQKGILRDRTEAWLSSRLATLFELEPEVMPQFSALLLRLDGADNPALTAYVGGLGLCGTPRAQNALRQILEWDAQTGRRSNALVALSFVEDPTEESVDLLWKLRMSGDFDLAASSLVGMGTMANSLAVRSPAMAERTVDRLVAALNTMDPQFKRPVLMGLGNSRHPKALPILSRFLSDPDPMARMGSVVACGTFGGRDARALLVHRLSVETESQVLERIARALHEHEFDIKLEQDLIGLLQIADLEKTRLAILQVLSGRPYRGFTKSLVARMATRDPSSRVREAAARMISTQ